jgi:YD repeat-containing protein
LNGKDDAHILRSLVSAFGTPFRGLSRSFSTTPTTTGYDGAGRLTKLKDHDENETTYAYSVSQTELGGYLTWSVTTTYPDAGVVTVLDAQPARQVKRTDQRGVETTLKFDDLGRVYERDYGGTVSPRTETFAFDKSGRLTAATRNAVLASSDFEWSRTYDYLGRPLTEVQRFGANEETTATYPTGFGYATDRDLHSMTWALITPAGHTVRHTLDRLNRMVEAAKLNELGETEAGATWTHNGAGQRETATLANAVTSAFDFDANGRLSTITHTANPSGDDPVNLFTAQYGYDAVGNRLFSRNWLHNPTDPNGVTNRSELYAYDNLNRLTAMNRGVLNPAGTEITTASAHAVLNSNQQWADPRQSRHVSGSSRAGLDRRGNWLDYQWTDSPAGTPVPHQQTRTANNVNEYSQLDPQGPGDPPNPPVVCPSLPVGL